MSAIFGRWSGRLVAAALVLALVFTIAPPSSAQQTRWRADYFPNMTLTDHNGRRLRFYDDVIRNKVVAINFIYTDCGDICPLDTAQLRRVYELLDGRVGRDIHFYSVSINPETDTPATLRRFMQTYDLGPGWTFLTGSRADIDLLQRRLGVRPAERNNLSSHDTSIIVGNETTGQWIKRSAFENPQLLANLLTETLSNYAGRSTRARPSYTSADRVNDTSAGAYLFRTRCASCHTMGGGDRLGPDLRGVTSSRPHAWLSRWIREPDRMIAERDPTALALMARYRNLPMPNLRLGEQDVEAIIDYMRRQDEAAARRQSAAASGPRRH